MARETPQVIRLNNEPEDVSHEFHEWAQRQDVKLLFIQPGKLT